MGDQRAGALVGLLRRHRPPRQRRPADTGGTSTIADDPALDYDAKLEAYLALADEHFDTERYWDWCSSNLPHLDEQVVEWVASDEFDRLLRDTVAATYPPHEQEEFLAHFRGLLGMWVKDNT